MTVRIIDVVGCGRQFVAAASGVRSLVGTKQDAPGERGVGGAFSFSLAVACLCTLSVGEESFRTQPSVQCGGVWAVAARPAATRMPETADKSQNAARLVRGARRRMATSQSRAGKTGVDAWCRPQADEPVSPVSRHTMPRGHKRPKCGKDLRRKGVYLQERTRSTPSKSSTQHETKRNSTQRMSSSPQMLLLSWQLIASINFSALIKIHQSSYVGPSRLCFSIGGGLWHQHIEGSTRGGGGRVVSLVPSVVSILPACCLCHPHFVSCEWLVAKQGGHGVASW